jgi:hypothetical protein
MTMGGIATSLGKVADQFLKVAAFFALGSGSSLFDITATVRITRKAKPGLTHQRAQRGMGKRILPQRNARTGEQDPIVGRG